MEEFFIGGASTYVCHFFHLPIYLFIRPFFRIMRSQEPYIFLINKFITTLADGQKLGKNLRIKSMVVSDR